MKWKQDTAWDLLLRPYENSNVFFFFKVYNQWKPVHLHRSAPIQEDGKYIVIFKFTL